VALHPLSLLGGHPGLRLGGVAAWLAERVEAAAHEVALVLLVAEAEVVPDLVRDGDAGVLAGARELDEAASITRRLRRQAGPGAAARA
jgi:hypothetical protein